MKISTYNTITELMSTVKQLRGSIELDDVQIILKRNFYNLTISIRTLQAIEDGTFATDLLTGEDFIKHISTNKIDKVTLNNIETVLTAIESDNLSALKDIQTITGFSRNKVIQILDMTPSISKGHFFYGNNITDKQLGDEDSEWVVMNNTTGEIISDNEEIIKIIFAIKKKNTIPKKTVLVNLETGEVKPLDKRFLNFVTIETILDPIDRIEPVSTIEEVKEEIALVASMFDSMTKGNEEVTEENLSTILEDKESLDVNSLQVYYQFLEVKEILDIAYNNPSKFKITLEEQIINNQTHLIETIKINRE